MGGRPGGAAPHFHRTISESFFVLLGQVRLHDGRRWADATAGDFLHVPPGGVHGFRNESGAPAHLLLLFVPGAPREDYFGRTAGEQELAELYARHDQYLV
jgi:mannose-6-phosphate isomerase-like protein (cupin superfamily)